MEYRLKYVNLGLRQKACLQFLNPPGLHFGLASSYCMETQIPRPHTQKF